VRPQKTGVRRELAWQSEHSGKTSDLYILTIYRLGRTCCYESFCSDLQSNSADDAGASGRWRSRLLSFCALLLGAGDGLCVPVRLQLRFSRWSLAVPTAMAGRSAVWRTDPDFFEGLAPAPDPGLGEQSSTPTRLELEDSRGATATAQSANRWAGDRVPAVGQVSICRLQPRPSRSCPWTGDSLKNGTDQAPDASPEMLKRIGFKVGQGS